MKCQFRCTYCFEPENTREPIDYNFSKIQNSLKKLWESPFRGSSICLHGGEPTIAPRRQLEELMRHIHSLTGVVSIQTNGFAIDDHLISLFKRYNVYVGISVDGPPELNILRGPSPSDDKITQEYNKKLWANIRKLRQENVPVSIMCILQKENAGTIEKVEKLKEWIVNLKDIGITSGRMNPMFASPTQKKYELSQKELLVAWIELYELNKVHGLNYNPMREMINNILGKRPSPCIFSRCDYFNTPTITILPDGTVGNCDRTFQEGIYLRSEMGTQSGRYESLRQTQCKDCKYWKICGGGCPAEGIDGDWRNKTRFCQAIYNLYSWIEQDLRGLFPAIKLVIDRDFDGNPFKQLVTIPQTGAHGDALHGDIPHGDGHGDSGHGDAPHGDAPHGDSLHGDSRVIK